MLHLGENRIRNKVNVLKKVKVDGQWKLCSAIIESDRKLKDRVQVNGRTEVHSEGVYYIEWREDNQRRRQSIANRNLVLEYARLKTLELDAKKAEIAVEANATPGTFVPPSIPSTATTVIHGCILQIEFLVGNVIHDLDEKEAANIAFVNEGCIGVVGLDFHHSAKTRPTNPRWDADQTHSMEPGRPVVSGRSRRLHPVGRPPSC
jgi:hypothetical protein